MTSISVTGDLCGVSKSAEMVADEAIAWHLGLEAAGADEWRRFVAWLEADPAHQAAYDRLTIDDAALADVVIEPVVAPVRRASTSKWLRWGGVGGGLAAAAAAAWLAVMPTVVASKPYTVETAPGEQRTVTLGDGTEVALNGGTRLLLDRAQPRFATLEQGEAVFTVVHHADQPFEVRSGGVTLRDVGTVFNVARTGPHLRVAVAEGSVLYQPDREAVSLTKGMALAMREGEDRVTVSRIDSEAVGGWAEGHLDFENAPLPVVAEDVSRSTGVKLAVAPEMAGQNFTGTLRTDRPSDEVMRSLAAMAGGELRRDGPGWTMMPRRGGAR